MFAAYTFFLIPLLAVACIGVLLSTITRNSAAAIVGALGVTLVLAIVSQIPGLEGLHPYLLTQQYFAWQGLLRTPTDWAPILHSAVGLRAVCRPGADRRLPRVPAPRRRRRLSGASS